MFRRSPVGRRKGLKLVVLKESVRVFVVTARIYN